MQKNSFNKLKYIYILFWKALARGMLGASILETMHLMYLIRMTLHNFLAIFYLFSTAIICLSFFISQFIVYSFKRLYYLK